MIKKWLKKIESRLHNRRRAVFGKLDKHSWIYQNNKLDPYLAPYVTLVFSSELTLELSE